MASPTEDKHSDLLFSILEAVRSTNNFVSSSYVIFAAIGIPINLVVIGTIIRWRRLHLARNIMWLGVGISNVGILTCHLLRALFFWRDISWVIQARCTWFSALFSSSRLLIMLLSILERHIYVNYSSWYKNYLSNRLLVALQVSLLFLIFLVSAAFSQLPDDGDEDFQSQFFTPSNFKTMATILLGFLPICLTGLVFISRFKSSQEFPAIEMVHLAGPRRRDDGGVAAGAEQPQGHFVQIGNEKVSRLEVGAFNSVKFSVTLYLGGIVFPSLILFSVFFVCVQISETAATCAPHAWYFVNVSAFLNGLYSSIMNALVFIIYSHDLKSIFFSKKKNVIRINRRKNTMG